MKREAAFRYNNNNNNNINNLLNPEIKKLNYAANIFLLFLLTSVDRVQTDMILIICKSDNHHFPCQSLSFSVSEPVSESFTVSQMLI